MATKSGAEVGRHVHSQSCNMGYEVVGCVLHFTKKITNAACVLHFSQDKAGVCKTQAAFVIVICYHYDGKMPDYNYKCEFFSVCNCNLCTVRVGLSTT